MCKSNNCVSCGKNISMFIEFGGPVGFQSISADGDGYVCSTQCKTVYETRQRAAMDALADETISIYSVLGVSHALCDY